MTRSFNDLPRGGRPVGRVARGLLLLSVLLVASSLWGTVAVAISPVGQQAPVAPSSKEGVPPSKVEDPRKGEGVPQVTGAATSTIISCLPVGRDYLGAGYTPSPYWIEKKIVLKWTGTPTAAWLIAYEFNASGAWGHNIYVNGHKIGTATGTRNSQTLCQ